MALTDRSMPAQSRAISFADSQSTKNEMADYLGSGLGALIGFGVGVGWLASRM